MGKDKLQVSTNVVGPLVDEDEEFDPTNPDHMGALEEGLKSKKVVHQAGKGRPNPEAKANCLSWIFFSWVSSIFSVAYRKRKKEGKELEDEDLWELPPWDETTTMSDKFDQAWEKKRISFLGPDSEDKLLSQEEARKALKSSLWAVVGKRLIIAGVCKFASSSFQFAYPILINQILLYIQNLNTPDEQPVWQGYTFAVVFGVSMMLKAFVENAYFFLSFRAGWQVRSTMTTEVFRKALRLSSSARQTMTVGEIVNLMQLDATKLDEFVSQSFHVLWDGIYQIAGYIGLLYFYIGWPTFVGFGFMCVAIPIQIFIFIILTKVNQKLVKVTDSRVKVSNEVLQGIEGIKMSAWEKQYSSIIDLYRKKELTFLKKVAYLTSFSMAYMTSVPALTAVCALSVYAVIRNGDVDAATLFTALTAFGQLRFPLMFYPRALSALAAAKVSLGRLAKFISLPEVTHNPNASAEDIDELQKSDSKSVVRIRGGEFYWQRPEDYVHEPSKDREKGLKEGSGKISIRVERQSPSESLSDDDSQVVGRPVLQDINLSIQDGQLAAIIGEVGVGKSALINAILNELYASQGTVAVDGTVAYASQTPWIFNDTLRENILFGEPMDEKRYRKVLKACQLAHDLDVLQDGDSTVIGEKGINLSGGQKARVSLARACYSRKDIVILDDPLSALDPAVARKVFDHAILKFLKGRTRIVVTNQLNILPKCDKIVVLEAGEHEPGRIVEQGRYSKLVSSGMDFSKLMAKYNGNEDEEEQEASPRQQEEVAFSPSSGRPLSSSRLEPINVAGLEQENQNSDYTDNAATVAAAAADDDENDDAYTQISDDEVERRVSSSILGSSFDLNKQGKALMTTEERAKGAVALSQYKGYVKALGGYFIFSVLILMFLLTQVAMVLNTAWISFWTADPDYERFPFEFYLAGYAIVAIILAILTYIRGIMIFFGGLRASRKLHKGLIDSILHSPMSFFDTTPLGRIVSRFSKDLYLIDTQLPMILNFFLFTTTFVIFSIAVIGVATPPFLIAVPPLTFIYFRFLQYYRPVARDAKRVESITRSPIYSHFSETIGGLSSVRAYGRVDAFLATNSGKVDENLKGWYLVKSIERWLALRLELLGSVITILAAVLAVWSAKEGSLDAGIAGLSLSFSIGITGLLNQTVRTFAELETGMNSVERVLHYTNKIDQEAPFESKDPPSKDWPTKGAIEINDLSMRYRDDTPLVLRNVSINIEGGQRIGICGRTGSGKSSTLRSLMRLNEPELLEDGQGPIKIDGIDISKIGLHELRSKISIVAQNPVLFSGTVRSNLDPFGVYSDEQIWVALEKCEMKQAIEESGGLDSAVSEFGDNFSNGQKQLLSLAKSLIVESRILLLDEASSSLDVESDEKIQSTIRNAFDNTTILTIAHRLGSIINSDKILVLDNGQVAEYDSPAALLSDPKSIFSSMVSELGPTQAAKLRALAKNKK